MLDFQKLVSQIAALGAYSCPENSRESRILSLAQTSFEEAFSSFEQLEKILKDNAAWTFWPLAIPLEPFVDLPALTTFKQAHSVVACDGSQIMPTRHEVYGCFLLNVGAAVFHYGQKPQAQLLSFPHLYYRYEDLFPLVNHRRVHIDESMVSFERGLKELTCAHEFACREQARGNPVLTLVDGSLIPFNVDRQTDRLQGDLLNRFEAALDAFKVARLPLMGYISHAGSSDLVNILRVWRCPYPESRCQLNCGSIDEENFPCSEIWPLSDRLLLGSKLPAKARSGFFLSGSRWSKALARDNQICFAYLNLASETARIEIPSWLFGDREMLEFSLAALLLQVQKGLGYPLGLAEAHNMAVVRQSDRIQFFALLSRQLVSTGSTGVRVSPKESKKRRGIV